MLADFFLIIKWWFYVLILGLISLPLTMKVFNRFYDKGYLFSKVICIAVASYLVWVLSSLRIAPFVRTTIFCVIAVVLLINILSSVKRNNNFFKKNYKLLLIFLGEEIIFLAGLVFWSYIRGYAPDINGLEKFMDFGFVNAILRTKYMPPTDMWFAGNSINYYYFGHYICAFLTKLSNMDSAVTYNLMLALIFSLCFSLTFSLSSNGIYLLGMKKMKTVIAAGIISAFLLTLGGNLHAFIYAYALPKAQNLNLYHGEVKTFFYPDSTRYIGYNPPTNDKTIHEFPIYSFVVSDLHGHVSDIPNVLAFLAFVLIFVTSKSREKKMDYIFAFMIAIMYMTNTWDFIIYLTVAFFAYIYKFAYMEKQKFGKVLAFSALSAIKIFALLLIFNMPFIVKFKNMTGGVGLTGARTPLYQLLVLWGYQLFLTICFLLFLIKYYRSSVVKDSLKPAGERLIRRFEAEDIYILILLISAVGLVIMPEIVYVRDIYAYTYHRANTMFKLTYQSFIMFAVPSGYIVVRIISFIKKHFTRIIALVLFLVMLSLPMLYPGLAIKGYYGNLKLSNYKGLYGLNFLKNAYPDDYKAVEWFSKNVTGQPVVLEANGDSYTDYGRISMATGLPTIEGWFAHEWLWRGGRELPSARSKDVEEIYESEDADKTRLLLYKYKVQYIVIGKLEREKFKNIDIKKLSELGELVLDLPETKIIKIKK